MSPRCTVAPAAGFCLKIWPLGVVSDAALRLFELSDSVFSRLRATPAARPVRSGDGMCSGPLLTHRSTLTPSSTDAPPRGDWRATAPSAYLSAQT